MGAFVGSCHQEDVRDNVCIVDAAPLRLPDSGDESGYDRLEPPSSLWGNQRELREYRRVR
jgi:hypothetical protein